MDDPRFINHHMLDQVSAMARESTRRRKNLNFHDSETDASHRLLNAVEPDSYIPPHCHLSATKDESIIVLRGRLGVVFFDASGKVEQKAVLEPGGEVAGVNIPHGTFHTLCALTPGSVFFEAKAGPYVQLTPEEKAGWAPAEDSPEAGVYLAALKSLFD